MPKVGGILPGGTSQSNSDIVVSVAFDGWLGFFSTRWQASGVSRRWNSTRKPRTQPPQRRTGTIIVSVAVLGFDE